MHTDFMSLSYDDIVVLKMALELFISDEIEGVSKSKKKENNSIARSVIKKLDKKHNDFNAEDLRVMTAALMYFQTVITDALLLGDADEDLINDSEKYLSISEDLLNFFENSLRSAGFIIDPKT